MPLIDHKSVPRNWNENVYACMCLIYQCSKI